MRLSKVCVLPSALLLSVTHPVQPISASKIRAAAAVAVAGFD